MPLGLQTKILRAIEEHQVLPAGATRHVATDARIIAATHRDLMQKIAKERFREDLHQRRSHMHIARNMLEESGRLPFPKRFGSTRHDRWRGSSRHQGSNEV